MNATLPPLNSAGIQSNPIAAEKQLEARYLGDDMDAVCGVAIAVNDPVLIANAALPLKNRRAALLNWRKKQVLELLRRDEYSRQFYEKAAPELRESLSNGEIALAEIVGQISSYQQDIEERRRAARMKAKGNLRESLRTVLRDSDGTEERMMFPSFYAILENGEVGLFRRRPACVQWARASGDAFVLGNFEGESHRVDYGLLAD